MTHRLGDWEGTGALEEKLLQNLDTELFELLNVPHELDEWGRRVYDDCGYRILYYQDSDGNTALGYEAWYPSSVLGDSEAWYPGTETDDEHGQPVHHCATARGDDTAKFEAEQRRFAEFLAAQDDKLPQFSSGRERITTWIASSSSSCASAAHDESEAFCLGP